MKVIVLGGSGMLGSMVVDCLSRQKGFQVTGTARTVELMEKLGARVKGVEWRRLDAETADVSEMLGVLGEAPWVVNAIGVIKPYIHDDKAAEVERATHVNALFPHLLARAAEKAGTRILQIATDCVFSGSKGSYVESDKHDALDVYGKTKSIGEVYSSNVFHLRVSIIGPEPKGHVSLLDWFLGQKRGARVNGYTNHQWNGVTTLQFARLCHGIVVKSVALPHVQHVAPTGTISKADLLRCFAREFRREDVTITPAEAKTVIDRTLTTTNEALNRQLWQAAGYAEVPTVPQMVSELAGFEFSFAGL